MPALNFQKQFAEKIKFREKCQTIRADRKKPIKCGDMLYLYTGMRTRECKKLLTVICHSVEPVEIFADGSMFLAGNILTERMKEKMARQDGFANWNEMWLWFRDMHGFPFTGQLIRWEKPKIKLK